jgi:hypothetical protein
VIRFLRKFLPTPVVFLLLAAPAHGQTLEDVGTRAQGMGGAFVAVADDATATWWNPAGIATGAYFSMIVERGQTTQPANPTQDGPAWRTSGSNYAVVFPALGFSYYRLRISEIRPPSSTGSTVGVGLRSIVARQFGVTIGQTIVKNVVIGATLNLVRGGVSESTSTGSHPLDDADNLAVSTQTRGDIDLGAMVTSQDIRLGFILKHANEPSFSSGGSQFVLERQARAGIALLGGPHGPLNAVTLAFDADLTKTHTATGRAQYIAGGLETWLGKRRLGLRGGVSHNLAEPVGTAASAGASLSVRSGLYFDGALTFGNDKARDGWDVSLRVTF